MRLRYMHIRISILSIVYVLGDHAFSTQLAAEAPKDFKRIYCALRERPERTPQFGFCVGCLDCQMTRPNIPFDRASTTSLNWGGYAALTKPNATRNSVTAVAGRWRVPTIFASSQNRYSSAWVGIDGYASSTVEQIGTAHDWIRGRQRNYAWFEMYPSPAYEIVGFPVRVGDLMGGRVIYKGNNVFELTIFNYTRGVYYIVPSKYTKRSNTARSSAEWIVEPPFSGSILPLAQFSTISFSNCSTTIQGKTGVISNSKWRNDKITIVTQSGALKALPSGLTSGGSAFTIAWKHQ